MTSVQHAQTLAISLHRLEVAGPLSEDLSSTVALCGKLWRMLLPCDTPEVADETIQEVMELVSSDSAFPVHSLNGQLRVVPALRANLVPSIRETLGQHCAARQSANDLHEAAGAVLFALPTLCQDDERVVKLRRGGVGGAVSIHLKNISRNRTEAGIAVLGLVPLFSGANPYVITAGLLACLLATGKATRLHIPEREATVYWGVIRSPVHGGLAATDTVILTTNSERALYDLQPLGEKEVGLALSQLEEWGTVKETIKHGWRACESYRLRD